MIALFRASQELRLTKHGKQPVVSNWTMVTKNVIYATFNHLIFEAGNTTITNRRQPHGTARKSRSTITRHQEDKISKATRYLFPIKMIAILEWT